MLLYGLYSTGLRIDFWVCSIAAIAPGCQLGRRGFESRQIREEGQVFLLEIGCKWTVGRAGDCAALEPQRGRKPFVSSNLTPSFFRKVNVYGLRSLFRKQVVPLVGMAFESPAFLARCVWMVNVYGLHGSSGKRDAPFAGVRFESCAILCGRRYSWKVSVCGSDSEFAKLGAPLAGVGFESRAFLGSPGVFNTRQEKQTSCGRAVVAGSADGIHPRSPGGCAVVARSGSAAAW